MTSETTVWQCEVELRPGEMLQLPPEIAQQVGTGRWRLTIEPANTAVRLHAAFLNSYAPSDEGLYDVCGCG